MQLEPTVGLEPTACALRVRRSTAELRRLLPSYYTPCNSLRNSSDACSRVCDSYRGLKWLVPI